MRDNRYLLPTLAAALMLPSAGRTAEPENAQTLTIVMVDNHFEPDHITFHTGQPYILRLENRGKEMHEFTAAAFLKASIVKDKSKLANNGTDIVVQPGQTVTVTLVAPATGHYDLICADHDWDGMVGSITVD